MPKHHLLISGTGRAGTTFLVQLLTQLGLDTGFSHPHEKLSKVSTAGMEWDLRNDENAPYIVKNPALCEYLGDVLRTRDIVIDHVLIPMRDLYSAAESRRAIARTGHPKFLTPLRRGFLRIRRPDDQEAVLAQHLYKLIYTLVERDIPMTMLLFPRLANDPAYLFAKLSFLIPGISFADFEKAFQAVCRPDLIHTFTKT